MNEHHYEKRLHIQTEGTKQNTGQTIHYHPYEPTPYEALDVLTQHYSFQSTDQVVDFGCGKGRLNFFIHDLFEATVIGIEMNEFFYQEALRNKQHYLQHKKKKTAAIHFQCCLAENYPIHPLDNRFYFFNPFTIQIFRKVIHNILRSMEETAREVELIIYYGSEDYIYFLDHHTPFYLKDDIQLPGLAEYNPSERFLIYHLDYRSNSF